MNEPVELSEEKCRELLAAGLVGRVAFCTPAGPRIIPVNHAVVDDAVVFRTTPYSELGTRVHDLPVALEVDHLDYDRQQGWSVVATGSASAIEDPDEVEEIRAVWDPRPWAGGVRPLYVRLRWAGLTGRRIGHGWSADTETPVRRRV